MVGWCINNLQVMSRSGGTGDPWNFTAEAAACSAPLIQREPMRRQTAHLHYTGNVTYLYTYTCSHAYTHTHGSRVGARVHADCTRVSDAYIHIRVLEESLGGDHKTKHATSGGVVHTNIRVCTCMVYINTRTRTPIHRYM